LAHADPPARAPLKVANPRARAVAFLRNQPGNSAIGRHGPVAPGKRVRAAEPGIVKWPMSCFNRLSNAHKRKQNPKLLSQSILNSRGMIQEEKLNVG
jgi:hypothetical protein